jgi:hypothetical protein
MSIATPYHQSINQFCYHQHAMHSSLHAQAGRQAVHQYFHFTSVQALGLKLPSNGGTSACAISEKKNYNSARPRRIHIKMADTRSSWSASPSRLLTCVVTAT